jgi:hypothetical protein
MKKIMEILRKFWTWGSMDKCELCNEREYTHVILCTEGGIRVCNVCDEMKVCHVCGR